MRLRPRYCFVFGLGVAAALVVSFAQASWAQVNPFDLRPRLGVHSAAEPNETTVIAAGDTGSAAVSSPAGALGSGALEARNPFDLVPRVAREVGGVAVATAPPRPEVLAFPPQSPGDADTARRGGTTPAVIIAGLLVLMAVTYLTQAPALRRMVSALVNANLLARLARDQRLGPVYWWAFVGVLAVAVFLFLAAEPLGLAAGRTRLEAWAGGELAALAALAVGLCAAVLLRLAALGLLATAFPLGKEFAVYRAAILLCAGVAGIACALGVAFAVYAPPGLARVAAFGVLAAAAGVWAFAKARVLFAAWPRVAAYPVHFSLYFCALEIAPLAILYKSLSG